MAQKRKVVCALLLCAALLGLLPGCAGAQSAVPAAAPGDSTAAASAQEVQSTPMPTPEPEPLGGGEIISGAETLTRAQETLILDYMDRAWEALARLEEPDFTGLFSDEEQARASAAGISLQIGMRRLIDGVDYSLTGYRYTLTCRSAVTEEDGTVAVAAMETSTQNFAQTPGVDSVYSGNFHYFRLEERGGSWYIREHMQYNTLYGRLMHSETGDLAQAYIEAVPAFLEELRAAQAERTAQRGETAELPAADYPYDREAALAYADAYALTRNTEWSDYSRLGGNCQNFVSQCLLAGGLPMDPYGSAVWKWYGSAPSDAPGRAGRSGSWSGVSAFLSYAQSNTGYGPALWPGAPYYSGQPGDLVQMGTADEWRHIAIIRGLVTDEAGRTADYLVNCNTNDLRNYPASLYGYPQFLLTRVAGWNG